MAKLSVFYLFLILFASTSTKNIEEKIRDALVIRADSPTVVTVSEKDTAQFSCSADGFPRPSIKWQREDDKTLPFGGQFKFGNPLIIENVHRNDRGIYYCIADNARNIPDIKPFRLKVEFRPIIKSVCQEITQSVLYEITLKCKVEAYPPPDISWFRDTTNLNNNDDFIISTLDTVNEITISTLKIRSVSNDHYGVYVCKASNKVGDGEIKIALYEP